MPLDTSCIFCKIIAGAIPCRKLHEDDRTLAFLDIGPLSRGHCLIIPKTHVVTLDQLDEDHAAAIGTLAPRLGRAVQQAVNCPGWNLLQNNGKTAGQVVMHVHFHIIPRTEGDPLGFRWPAGKLDPDVAAQLQSDITRHLA